MLKIFRPQSGYGLQVPGKRMFGKKSWTWLIEIGASA